MIAPRSEIARLQSDFYRDQFRKMLRWLLYVMIVIYVLLALIIYTILFEAPQRYYANTTEGKILPMPQAIALKPETKSS